jgi:hypothetical protein
MSAGVTSLVAGAGRVLADLGVAHKACLVLDGDAAGGIDVGDLEELRLAGGEPLPVRVLAIDTISRPGRAKVERLDTGEVLTVPMFEADEVPSWIASEVEKAGNDVVVDSQQTTIYQDYEDAFSLHDGSARRQDTEEDPALPAPPAAQAVPASPAAALVGELRSQVAATVQDFKDKGAVGALRDASLDACDIVHEAFGAAVDGACKLRAALVPETPQADDPDSSKAAAAGA